jgi:hypothetical protein
MSNLFGKPRPALSTISAAGTIAGGGALNALMPVIVRNVRNTADLRCGPCSSWLDHSQRARKGLPQFYCSAAGCGNGATVGGHIIRVRHPDRNWYIIPLCDECNARGEAYGIASHVQLVPARALPSCGR